MFALDFLYHYPTHVGAVKAPLYEEALLVYSFVPYMHACHSSVILWSLACIPYMYACHIVNVVPTFIARVFLDGFLPDGFSSFLLVAIGLTHVLGYESLTVEPPDGVGGRGLEHYRSAQRRCVAQGSTERRLAERGRQVHSSVLPHQDNCD